MEKKTIGGFIAALRKAGGMTQKDLAERLNVSDKTVSRWETDEGTPDLSLVPVIAEIFGVTCDELLRGRRRPPEERELVSEAELTAKGARERRRILKAAMTRYRSCTWIAMGVSCLGLVAAFICNFAFLRAPLGGLLGAAFFIASAVCQAVFVSRALLGVDDEDMEGAEVSDFRRRVIGLAEVSFGLDVGFLGFTEPLIWLGTHVGLRMPSLLELGGGAALILLTAYAVVCWFVNGRLVKKGVYTLGEREYAVFRCNRRLQAACAGVLAGVMLVTFAGHVVATSTDLLMEGTVFEDYDSFAAFMEQDVSYGAYENAVPEEGGTYYDEDGNEISEEEALRRYLYDGDGNPVVSYISRNKSVIRIDQSVGRGTVLPITVYTEEDFDRAVARARSRKPVFIAAYMLEAAAAAAFYLLKRQRRP